MMRFLLVSGGSDNINTCRNTIIIEYSKMKAETVITDLEKSEFYKYVYKHLYNIPAHSIQEAVILVSPSNDTIKIIEKFSGSEVPKNQHRFPKMCSLEGGISLVHPTEGLLNPHQKHKFVTMHYIFKTVKRAKFIFVFSESDFQSNGVKNIKFCLKGLLSFFADEKDQHNVLEKLQLIKSCAIMVTDPKRSVENYRQFLKKMYAEPKFLDSEAARRFTSQLITKQSMILFDKDCSKEKMIDFLGSIRSIELEGRVSFSLHSSAQRYKEQKNRWLKILSDQIIKKMAKQVLNPQAEFEESILAQIKQLKAQLPPHFNGASRDWQRDYRELADNRQLVLHKFVQNQLQIINYLSQIKGNQQVEQSRHLLELTLKAFYCSGYLKSELIEYFFLSSLQIDRFLRDVIFEKVNFKEAFNSNAQVLNEALGQIITVGLTLIEQTLRTCDNSYPFQMTIGVLNKLLSTDKTLAKKQALFWTNRIDKKYKKYRAEIAYKQASLLNTQFGVSKINRIKAWIAYLEYSTSSTLIDPAKNQMALTVIADLFTQAKQYSLALKIYDIMPEYQVYKKIIKIYEKEMKLYPEMLRHTLQENWQAKVNHLQDFCVFLMKIGFNEKVRELCLQGLRVMSCIDNNQGRQIFNKVLIDARSTKSQLLHEEFLESSILKPKPIIFSQALLKEIKQKQMSL